MDSKNEESMDDFQFDDVAFTADKDYDDSLLLRSYYDNRFPWDLIYEWLSFNHFDDAVNGQANYFGKREFSMSYTRPQKQIVLRHQSSPDISNIKTKTMGEFKPGQMELFVFDKIDIGPVYSDEPVKRVQATKFEPRERELVFDIDINDYDEVRSCCKDQTLCTKCWGLLALAAEYLTHQIKECFGFHQILYVFSGGRGLHIWVSDKAAMQLTYDMRRSLVSFLRMDHTSDYLHPQLNYCFEKYFIRYFEEHMIDEQMIFSDEKQLKSFLEQFPVDYGKKKNKINLREKIERVLEENSEVSDVEKWAAIKESLATLKDSIDLNEIIYRVVMFYTHPRLDEPVTIGFNHLLKSPFCIHPRTKKLCVPIEFSEIYDFDPNDVPTLFTIAKENDENESNDQAMDTDDKDSKKSKKSKKKSKNQDNSFKRYRRQFSLYVNSLKSKNNQKMDVDQF